MRTIPLQKATLSIYCGMFNAYRWRKFAIKTKLMAALKGEEKVEASSGTIVNRENRREELQTLDIENAIYDVIT